jgi:hypothetical protein
MIKALLVVMALGTWSMAAPKADFVVAPTGNDSAAGSVDRPFATLGRAIVAVREVRKKEPTKPLTVLIRGGAYELAEPIRFTPDDSGSADAPVMYANWPDETPIFSGGKKLSGWNVHDGKWELSLPEVKEGRWKFSQLFVNNVRRFRPRAAGGKYLNIAAAAPTNEAFKGEGDNRFHYGDDDVSSAWKNPSEIEFLTFHRWTMSRLPVDSIDPAQKLVSLRGRTMHAEAAKLGPGTRYLVENVAEELNAAGEWYLDRPTGTLTYIPEKGEDPATAEVYAPRLEQLVSFEGSTKGNPFVTHITLRGLTFRHSNWNIPKDGHSTGQAEIDIRGAIRVKGANFITLDNVTVSQVGHYAIDFGESCSDCTIINCDLYDIGAGGIRCGTGWDTDARETISSNFIITNNRIHGIGRMHPGAIGIWIGHSPHNFIAHNEIFDTYYTGISVGWRWGEGFSWAHDNIISQNLIHHIGQGRLDDMGGIYTLGESPGAVISGNHLYEVRRVKYGGEGIYLDEGSAQIHVVDNLVHDCDDGAFFMHYGTTNTINNNIFALSKYRVFGLGRPDKSGPLYVHHNVIISANPQLYGDGIDDQYRFDHNAYFATDGKPLEFPGKLNFEQWQKSRVDEGSTVGNAKIDELRKNDFLIPPIAANAGGWRYAGREIAKSPLPATQPVAEGFAAP